MLFSIPLCGVAISFKNIVHRSKHIIVIQVKIYSSKESYEPFRQKNVPSEPRLITLAPFCVHTFTHGDATDLFVTLHCQLCLERASLTYWRRQVQPKQ